MYCKKLKSIVSRIESIRLNINNEFIHRFDKWINENTTDRERLRLSPIKMANEMGITQELSMKFFNIGKEVKLFKAVAFYTCQCGEHFQIFSFSETQCINGCEVDIMKNKDKVFIYFELLDEVEELENTFGNIYPIDYITSEDLGSFNGTYDEYELVIGEEGAKKLLDDSVYNLEYKEISIIHISDLHFGSSYNTGIDNKAGLSGINNMKPDLFNQFCKKVRTISPNYLMISGDVTSRNEEEGFEEFNKKVANLGIDNEKIYIVPGNHECDRSKKSEQGQFALFSSYTTLYKTNFSKENYILDEGSKLFIYGFNSVNYRNDNGYELFYIKSEEFEKLEKTYDILNKEYTDFNKYTKIALLHNNLIPHSNVEVKEYAEVLNTYFIKYKLVDLGFNLVCSGHKHEEVIEKHTVYKENEENEIILASVPSLCGNVYNGKNGFHVIKILTDDKFKVNKVILEKYETTNLHEFQLKGEIKINL
ncbi:metallophosphoesterase [Clostridium botulinum]|uniref:Putative phosphohydrolase n=1 Tax=Clostridium botulinum CFSAN001627 TaxID=1232189 RepID=M1ZRZ4_CLOBO|nr:metallophosphoesterase [Clostridium botulinum]EKN42562.1 putative phosphohydrolase [Clostridium botulinum CFSAN001627]AWB29592.1 metallophosphoesterase [Clostridium botulinum]KON10528.1 hypothetical protein ACP52_06955 [Clostridium botulinum]KOR54131.1 hypothetical protein ADT23_04265 [Clostridium botulinum]MBD5643754.1 metallophosphoesterase [Clostridium botulinum]